MGAERRAGRGLCEGPTGSVQVRLVRCDHALGGPTTALFEKKKKIKTRRVPSARVFDMYRVFNRSKSLLGESTRHKFTDGVKSRANCWADRSAAQKQRGNESQALVTRI